MNVYDVNGIDIETFEVNGEWWWQAPRCVLHVGPFPTEDEALQDARRTQESR